MTVARIKAGCVAAVVAVLTIWGPTDAGAQETAANGSATTPTVAPASAPSGAPAETAIAPPSAPSAGAKKHLIVGTKVAEPFSFKGANGQWTGISIELWNEVAKELRAERGMTFEWSEAPNTTELVAGVASGKFDVGVAAITKTPERAERVDFSDTMFESGLGVAVRSEQPSVLGRLLSVLSVQFFTAVASLALVLFAVGFVIWAVERRANPNHFQPGASGLWSGIWWSAVTMTTVGYGDKVPVTVVGRLLALFWMFASLIMVSSFTAAIAASLTTQQLMTSVRGVEDLPRVRVGAKRGEGPARLLDERGIRNIPFPTLLAGLEAVSASEVDAFVHDTPLLAYEIRRNPALEATIAILPDALREEQYGIAVNPGLTAETDLVRAINRALIRVKDEGKFDAIVQSYLGH